MLSMNTSRNLASATPLSTGVDGPRRLSWGRWRRYRRCSMPAPQRRFPPPWSVEETEACFIARDANGQALAYVYFEEEPGRRAAAHLLTTRVEARRIAANIAKLPEMLLRR